MGRLQRGRGRSRCDRRLGSRLCPVTGRWRPVRGLSEGAVGSEREFPGKTGSGGDGCSRHHSGVASRCRDVARSRIRQTHTSKPRAARLVPSGGNAPIQRHRVGACECRGIVRATASAARSRRRAELIVKQRRPVDLDQFAQFGTWADESWLIGRGSVQTRLEQRPRTLDCSVRRFGQRRPATHGGTIGPDRATGRTCRSRRESHPVQP